MRFTAVLVVLLSTAQYGAIAQTAARKPPRAIVVDLANYTQDRHGVISQFATDALAAALTRRGTYEVLSRQAVERAAAERKFAPPYDDNQVGLLARDLDAVAMIYGDIRTLAIKGRSPRRRVEVGIVVQVRDLALNEAVNGAAERGVRMEPPEGASSDTIMVVDAAIAAAELCANRISEYRPIVGTVLNHESTDLVVVNKGTGDGVKKGQEFIAFRGSTPVARLRMFKPYGVYTVLKVISSTLGVRPEDKVVAVFPEPKFAR